MTLGFYPRFTITNRLTEALTRIERARGFLEAATLSEDWIREMGERALVLEPHHTTHIEGTQLTLDQAERLMAGETVPEADPDDVRELLNYRRAFDFVSEYLSSGWWRGCVAVLPHRANTARSRTTWSIPPPARRSTRRRRLTRCRATWVKDRHV